MKIMNLKFQHSLESDSKYLGSGIAFVDLDCETREVEIDIVNGDEIRHTTGMLENCLIFAEPNRLTESERAELVRCVGELIKRCGIELG